jgi:hypothetical protein
VRARISASVQTDPGANPSLLYKGYLTSFLEVKRPGSSVIYLAHLAPRLKRMSRAIPILLPRAFTVCSRVKFTFTYTFLKLMVHKVTTGP